MAIKSFRRTRHESVDEDPVVLDELLDLTMRPRLADLTTIETGTEDEKTQQYNDWAERLREKRQRAQRRHLIPEEQSSEHWSADSLYAESRHVEENEQFDRPSAGRVGELMAMFDLPLDASAEQVAVAYRSLAKQHHPDRFGTADAETQQFHADRMAEINRAHKALQQLDRA